MNGAAGGGGGVYFKKPVYKIASRYESGIRQCCGLDISIIKFG